MAIKFFIKTFTIGNKDVTPTDMLRLKTENGYYDYYPAYYVDLLKEQLNYNLAKAGVKTAKHAIDFTYDKISDLFKP